MKKLFLIFAISACSRPDGNKNIEPIFPFWGSDGGRYMVIFDREDGFDVNGRLVREGKELTEITDQEAATLYHYEYFDLLCNYGGYRDMPCYKADKNIRQPENCQTSMPIHEIEQVAERVLDQVARGWTNLELAKKHAKNIINEALNHIDGELYGIDLDENCINAAAEQLVEFLNKKN